MWYCGVPRAGRGSGRAGGAGLIVAERRRPRARPSSSRRGLWLWSTAPDHRARAEEAGDHHRPGRRFRDGGGRQGPGSLAESLATTVLAESAAFAAAFGVLGQIKAYRGDLAEARRLYDEGLKLCEPGSMFDLNIQVLKAISLIAEDDRAGVEAAYAQIVEISPVAHRQLGLLFLPAADDGLARQLAALADRTSARHARRAIAYLHYRVAPYFRSADQCANIMRGPLVHLVRRFGPSVASEAIWREMPQELHHLLGMRGTSSPGS